MKDQSHNWPLILATRNRLRGAVVGPQATRQPVPSAVAWRHVPADCWPSALAFEPAGQQLALGGRTGWIHLYSLKGGAGDQPPSPQRQRLLAGGPILHLQFLEEKQLLSCDAAGALYRWHLTQTASSPPVRLEDGDASIARLQRLEGSRLAGVSFTGSVYEWDWSNGTLVDNISASPANEGALVYDSQGDCLIYVDTAGYLVTVQRTSRRVVRLPAHVGCCHLVHGRGNRLITLGTEDGRLIVWEGHNGDYQQTHDTPAPRHIRSAGCCLDGEAELLMLVRRDGRGAAFLLDGTLQPLWPLPGEDYLLVHQPSSLDLVEARRCQALDQASALCHQIQTAKEGETAIALLEPMLEDLSALGFASQALRLKAEAAQQQQDALLELRTLHELVCMLGWGSVEEDTLCRYLHLLVDFGLYREAAELMARLAPNGVLCDALRQIFSPQIATALITGQSYIVCPPPDVLWDRIVDAADAVDHAVQGLWQVQAAAPIDFGAGNLTAADVVTEYQQVRDQSPIGVLPAAISVKAWWLRRRCGSPAQTVLVPCVDEPSTPPLVAALMIHTTGAGGSVIVPSVLIDASLPQTESRNQISGVAHNRQLRQQLAAVESPSCEAWLHTIDSSLGQALRRLRSKAEPDWRV